MSTRPGIYRPYHLRESLLPWAPQQGNREFLNSKYRMAGRAELPPDADDETKTAYQQATTTVHPEDYHVPERKLGMQILPMEKPTKPFTSDAASFFVNYGEEAARLRALSIEQLERAFYTVDARGEGYLLPSELRMALREAQGGTEPADVVVAMLENNVARRAESRVSLQSWFAAVDGAASHLEAELACQRPEVMKTTGSLREKSASARSPRKSPGGAGGSSSRSPSRSGVGSPAGGRVDLGSTSGFQSVLRSPDAEGVLGASRTSGGPRRLLTAGPLGLPEGEGHVVGMHTGAMRKAQLAAEGRLSGASPAHGKAGGLSSPSPDFRLAGPSLQSTFQRDIGAYGHDPRHVPLRSPSAAGFVTTTSELIAGTTRVSAHVPGYMGHVPHIDVGNSHGAAAEQGLGATKRDTFHAKTNLSDNFTGRVSGYTGYCPRSAVVASLEVDKARGIPADSDYDHSCGNVEAYWQARTAALEATRGPGAQLQGKQ